MPPAAPRDDAFILEAFDRDQWCAVLQALFHVPEFDALRSILGDAADTDPELRLVYFLTGQDLDAIIGTFGVAFDTSRLDSREIDIVLSRWRPLCETPYLVHTGYELPLLLDGRKKLARISHHYPPATFEGEDRFEHWVVRGVLHKEEDMDEFDPPSGKDLGLRTVYYAPKGEEWRIPASRLIWKAAGESGGWNEHFERLEGMLYGYEDWQNEWWIDTGLTGGGFGGLPFCCAVTAQGLASIEASGFRALPPIEGAVLLIARYKPDTETEFQAAMLQDLDAEALVRFVVSGRAATDLFDLRQNGPWQIPRDRIPELNKALKGPVVLVARRARPL